MTAERASTVQRGRSTAARLVRMAAGAAAAAALVLGARAGEPGRPVAPGSPAGPRQGLAAPEAVLERVLGKDPHCRPEVSIIRTCQVFAAHAVLATHDCDMGMRDVEVRPRAKGTAPAALCAPAYSGRAVRLDENFEPIGVVGHHLYAEWVDTFGALIAFRIDDLESGKRVFEDARREASAIAFQIGARGLEIDYWRPLDNAAEDCTPGAGDLECWARILARAGVPPDARVPPPDCRAARTSDPQASLQISAHVHLQRMSLSAARYLADVPACDVAP